MSSGFQIQLDTRAFDAAIAQYAAASKKDFAEAVNRSVKSLAIEGLKIQKQAKEGAIKAIEDEDWWPKYVAKILHNRRVASARSAFWKSKRRSMKRLAKASHYTIEQARRFSKQLVRKRLVAVNFMRFFFGALGRAAGGSAGGKSFGGFVVSLRKATPQNPTSDWRVAYEYKKRSQKTAQKAQRILNESLHRAMIATIADMKLYINRKMEQTARQHSARAA